MNNLYKKTKHVYTKIGFEICTDKGGADILINHSNGYSWVYFKTQKNEDCVNGYNEHWHIS